MKYNRKGVERKEKEMKTKMLINYNMKEGGSNENEHTG